MAGAGAAGALAEPATLDAGETADRRGGTSLPAVVGAVAATAAFAADLALPAGVTCGLLYLFPLLLTLSRLARTDLLVLAASCTGLALLAPAFKAGEALVWTAAADRLLALGVLWSLTLLGLRRRGVEDALREARARFAARTRELAAANQALQQEVADRREVEARLRHAQERCRGIYEASKDAIAYCTLDGHILDINAACAALTGFAREELLGRSFDELVAPEQREPRDRRLRAVLDTGEAAEFETVILRRDGSLVPTDETVFVVRGADGGATGLASIIKDITERREAEARLRELAYYDCLTGLPNRRLFMELLKQAMSRVGRMRTRLAVLFLDLDGFKLVNDTLGHRQGDLVLKTIAERLATCIRASDVLSRQGGDEFTFVLENIASADDAALVARKILAAAAGPCSVEGHEIALTGSIGIALCPGDAADADTLIQYADTAMYAAKARGNEFRFYSADMHARALERLRLGSELRRALQRREFVLHYQPIIDAHTRGISGVEALIRWQHPERGLIPPATFIPLAEETDVIVPITEWVLRTACGQARRWRTDGHAGLRVAVNLSRRLFREAGLVPLVRQILDETGLSPAALELELTESLLIQDRERTVAMLKDLHALGVRISIDDFGIEYSSLGYLKHLPITTLKIDQSFVRDIIGSEADTAIAQVVITLGRCRNLTVVAEGVEAEAQAGFLSAQQCHELQGFYFSAPVPPEAITALLCQPAEPRTGSPL